jgi:NAD(P)H-dependent flavin oxidoreductase YrpB (nitropropane dioxygenase family)
MGQCAGAIKDIKPAAEIVQDMMTEAIAALRNASSLIGPLKAKL